MNILVFGTGSGSKRLMKDLKNKVNIIAFVDNNSDKVGTIINSKEIISPNDIKDYKFDYIIIASDYYKEITKQLLEIGICKEKILAYFKKYEYVEYTRLFGNMLKISAKLKMYFSKKYDEQLFVIKWYSIFIHPFYIIRKGLYTNIRELAKMMDGDIIDLGCGSKPYKNLFIDAKSYIGIDIENSGHNHLSEDIDIFYDGKIIPFDDSSIDGVFSSEVFEHIFNINDILNEINRVLKMNGKVLVSVPFVWDEHEIPYDFARYTSFGIRYLLEKHGFEIEHEIKSNNYIETLFQMWNTYLFESFPQNKIFNFILTLLLIFPANILSLIFAKILPKNHNFFNNNVILAKKIKDINIVSGDVNE